MLNGRISAILALGMGFNPELTGRQNAAHTAGLMGFSAEKIRQTMPDIEAFAEIGEYFDKPIRTYSSGMQMRVAFSVATANRPEILIVDEALSVGDSYFQHKSFDRIRRFKEKGVSILFVSHGMGDVRALCDRVILLDKGTMIKDGLPDEVIDYYNAMIADKENAKLTVEQRRSKGGWLHTRSGTYEATVKRIELLDADTGETVTMARVGQRLRLRLFIDVHSRISRLVLGYMLRDRTGHVVWGTNTWHTRQIIENVDKETEIRVDLTFTCTLGPGSYSFTPALVSSDTHLENNYEWTDNALVFDVANLDQTIFIGTSWLDATFELHRG